MASQTNSHATPPSFDTLREWWTRPIATIPASYDRKPTCKEYAACFAPCCGSLFTIVIVFLFLSSIDKAHSHAKISIQSMAVSSATWQVGLLVKDPSSRYSIYYDGDDVAVRLGTRNAAVLNTTRRQGSRDHNTAFSLCFVAQEGNRSDVVSGELEIKLRAKHKRHLDYNEAGHFNIRCQNLTRGLEKIICQSSFTNLNMIYFEDF